jgi:hypothetical protein
MDEVIEVCKLAALWFFCKKYMGYFGTETAHIFIRLSSDNIGVQEFKNFQDYLD